MNVWLLAVLFAVPVATGWCADRWGPWRDRRRLAAVFAAAKAPRP